MKKHTDLEIFLLAIEASGKRPHVNYTDRQMGILNGVTIGMVLARDGVTLKEATETAYSIRQTYYSRWVKEEFNETSVES